jgi:hypothetical protein
MTDELAGQATGSADPLAVLITVQDLDVSISQLEHRRANLAERRELEGVEAALAELASREAEAGGRRRALTDRIAEFESQVSSISARSKALQGHLYGDRGSSARDLQAMDEEIQHLASRRAEIEEVELETMEEQESVDFELAEMAEERAQLETVAGSLQMAITAAETVVVAELSAVRQLRAAEAERLPTALRDQYETLRARLGGIGAARLVGNRCEGCHLELPSVEVDRIRHQPPGTVATCDQCGRILVRAAPGHTGGPPG